MFKNSAYQRSFHKHLYTKDFVLGLRVFCQTLEWQCLGSLVEKLLGQVHGRCRVPVLAPNG